MKKHSGTRIPVARATAPDRPDRPVRPVRARRRHWLLGLSGAGALSALAPATGLRAASSPVSAPPATAAAPTQDGKGTPPDLPLPAIGSRIDLPALTLLDGESLDAGSRAGKAVVLYWWASWCPFCAEQSPLMDKLWRSHGDKGLLVLGLSIDRQARTAADHLKRKGYAFPSAWLSPELGQRLAKPKGLPVTVVLDPDGKVIAAESGQLFEEDIAELATLALASRSSGG